MRLLRWLELALATGLAGLLLVAGWGRPAGFVAGSPAAVDATARPAQPAAPAAAQGKAGPRDLLDAAAARHGLSAHLVEAVAWWESGWDQSRVSEAGAVGLMQVQPEVAAELAPRLLGHSVDVHDPAQNADAGAAILKAYIDDQGGDVGRGLAAYNQGPRSIVDDGIQPDTQDYVNGILALSDRLDHGEPVNG